jgi:hypothetical protein
MGLFISGRLNGPFKGPYFLNIGKGVEIIISVKKGTTFLSCTGLECGEHISKSEFANFSIDCILCFNSSAITETVNRSLLL